jgi:hypothetical protein
VQFDTDAEGLSAFRSSWRHRVRRGCGDSFVPYVRGPEGIVVSLAGQIG